MGRAGWLSGRLWLLIGVLGVPLAAQEMVRLPPQTIHLRGDEIQDVYLNLGADNRPEVEVRARLALEGSWPDRDRLSLDVVHNSSQELGTETVLHQVPGGRVLWLKAAADRCAVAGTYPATVEISTSGGDPGEPGKTWRLPLRVEIAESWACGTGRAKFFFFALPVSLSFFFLLSSVTHSRRLSAGQLAKCLQPLCWDENGGLKIERSEDKVRDRITEQLSLTDRAKHWISANPLHFGSSRQGYQETFEIWLNGQLEALQVRPVAPAYAFHYWEKREGPHLFARAGGPAGVTLFGVLGPDHQLSGLTCNVPPGLNLETGKELRSLDLLATSSGRLRGRPAGWRLQRVQIRASSQAGAASAAETRQ